MAGHRPKKRRLSRIQQELIWMTEEAGEEDLPTAITTLQQQHDNIPPDELLVEAEDALRGLHRAGLISFELSPRFGRSRSTSPQDVDAILKLPNLLQYDPKTRFWLWNEGVFGQDVVSIVLTSKGRKALDE